MSSPPEKRRKSDGGGAAVSWRDRSIEKFGLAPVPSAWSASVAAGSDDAWRRYYQYRIEKEKRRARRRVDVDDRYDSDGNSIPGDDDCDDEKEKFDGVLFSWVDYGMEALVKSVEMGNGCEWSWTPHDPSLRWDDDTLKDADYCAQVWSPFAIPHAIRLYHTWYGRVRYSSSEMRTDWAYVLLDFEEEEVASPREPEGLCSFRSDDGKDVVNTSQLTKTTCAKLRKFLYGANTQKCKEATCSDKDFLFLLFGSMGCADEDLESDAGRASLGYAWCPWKDPAMKQTLFDERAPANDDPKGEPPSEMEGYNPRWCSWLRHRILEVADSLGPISKHYQPPPKAAARKVSPREGDSRGFGSGYDSEDPNGFGLTEDY